MIKLKKDKNDRNNQVIYYLEGNTYPIKGQLGSKGLGFKWYGGRKMWWMYENKLTPEKVQALQTLGADTSEYGAPVTPSPQQTAQPEAPQAEPTQEVTNKTDSDSGKSFRELGKEHLGQYSYDHIPGSGYYGYNIKTDIYATELSVDIDGQDIPLKLMVDRWYKKGRRKVPRYLINLYYGDTQIWSKAMDASGAWGEYNEDELVLTLPEKIKNLVAQKKQIYGRIKNELALGTRDPEFTKILEGWSDAKWDDKKYIYQFIPQKTIQINEHPYTGEYKILLNEVGNSIYMETDVDHPLAPRNGTLGSFGIAATVQNLEQFNQLVDETITSNHDSIVENYIKYLKSFAFTQEEEEQSRGAMDEVVNMIGKNYDTAHFVDKLSELGYIRPSKKVKKEERQPGFLPKDKIKWVVESKKIVNDAYRYTQDPNQFYSTIAYYLHRKVRNISSYTDMMLVTAIDHWHKLSERFGHEISYEDVDKYFGEVSSKIYREMFHKEPPQSRADQASDFYNQFGRGQSQTNIGGPGAVESFVGLAVGLGANEEETRSNPKRVYRQLVLKYHPDVNSSEEAQQIIRNLNAAYESLPQEIRASHWYNKIKYSC
tara:strand:+ start:7007 stop:8800 length:1794 start_codon:yes stop_codon:yes gene_type:complete